MRNPPTTFTGRALRNADGVPKLLNPFGANLGDTQGARQSYAKSLAVSDSLLKNKSATLGHEIAHARMQRLISAVTARRALADSNTLLTKLSARPQ